MCFRIVLKIFLPLIYLLAIDRASSSEGPNNEKLLNYSTLDHKIALDYLRAGNHDAKGINNYYFKVMFVGLIDDEKEHLLSFDKKRKVEEEYLRFGEMQLPAFKNYEVDSKGKNIVQLVVEGDALRELVRKVMNDLAPDKKHHIPEYKVAVQVKIQLYEQEKKYWVIDDDRQISELSYFAIPFATSDKVLYQDQHLVMSDKKGLRAILNVLYDKNVVKEN
ncbi:MAG: hypothetical protein AB8G05_02270 [Oligoflexales bacterium]